MAEGDYVLPQPTDAEIEHMATTLSLLDANGEGVTIDRFRAVYPKVPRSYLIERLKALQAQGRATSQLRTAGGPVPFEFWFKVSE